MDTLLAQVTDRTRFPPRGRPVVEMTWRNLLFAHWAVRPEALRPLVPNGLEIDTFDSQAWIGIVPFHLTIRYRWMPFNMSFPEVNVRTYVRRGRQSGVLFLSLDAHSRLAVAVARKQYALPYHTAKINMRSDKTAAAQRIHFQSSRRSMWPSDVTLDVKYSPQSECFRASSEMLENWLTERYCLFTANKHGRIGKAEIDHQPWQLQNAAATFATNTMLQPLGLKQPTEPPLLHFSRQVMCNAWSLRWEVCT
jgi:hypothetical protein